MIVRTASELKGTPRHVSGPGWGSARILVAGDGLGYSLHETVVAPGTELELEYKNHIEANYCVAGSGEVVDLATGEVHQLQPGSVYVLDQHDRHVVRAFEDGMKLVCIFTPALQGDETHTEDGSYDAH